MTYILRADADSRFGGSGVVLAYEQVLLRNGQQFGVHTPYSNA